MFKFIIKPICLILLLLSNVAFAAKNNNQTVFYDDNKDVAIKVELFEFDSAEQRQNAVALAKTLRCPQCQNQNLVESNSPIAKDLRLKVYLMIKEGKTDQEIIDYMTFRFGDFVLYDPALNSKTYLLWFIPFLLLFAGLWFAIRAVKQK